MQCSCVCLALLNHSSCEEFLCVWNCAATTRCLSSPIISWKSLLRCHLGAGEFRSIIEAAGYNPSQFHSPFLRAAAFLLLWTTAVRFYKQQKLSPKEKNWRTWTCCGKIGEHWPHPSGSGSAGIMSERFSPSPVCPWGQNKNMLYLVIKSTGRCNRIKKDNLFFSLNCVPLTPFPTSPANTLGPSQLDLHPLLIS